LQGEKQARLKELEDMLLTELSNSEDGNILENDKLIATLETLKKESAEIRAEMDQAEVTL
jgi:dynein heavy chain 1